jgi:hypothetical protein
VTSTIVLLHTRTGNRYQVGNADVRGGLTQLVDLFTANVLVGGAVAAAHLHWLTSATVQPLPSVALLRCYLRLSQLPALSMHTCTNHAKLPTSQHCIIFLKLDAVVNYCALLCVPIFIQASLCLAQLHGFSPFTHPA